MSKPGENEHSRKYEEKDVRPPLDARQFGNEILRLCDMAVSLEVPVILDTTNVRVTIWPDLRMEFESKK